MTDKLRCACCSRKAGFPVFKPVSEFYARKGTKRGYQDSCKHCIRLRNREYERRARKGMVRTRAAQSIDALESLYARFALQQTHMKG